MKSFRHKTTIRRGATIVTVSVMMLMIVGFAALTVDVGLMFNTKAELQRSVDAAVLAGTMSLASPNRLQGGEAQNQVFAEARTATGSYAGQNEVYNGSPGVNDGDIQIGYLSNPFDPNEAMDFSDPDRFNAVRAVVRRDDQANGPIDLLFAFVFGRKTATMASGATAALWDTIRGFGPDAQSGNAELLPFALRQSSWLNLLNGSVTTGDNFSYDAASGQVTSGSDGVLELNLYPGNGDGYLPPGNFGTVDIGPSNNSTADIERQILYGVSAEDLAIFGGELVFGPDGTLLLNGDTGISAAVKDELEFIKGKPRAIPIFTTVTGNGNNSQYTIVAFAGIRVVHVDFQGNPKRVIIQPATIIDDSVIIDSSSGTSYFVYAPPRLVR